MREMRERVLSEEFQKPEGTLVFSCKQVVLSPPPGGKAEGFFEISNTEGCQTEGFVRAFDERMECLTPHFCGSTGQIDYRFDADGMQDGETRSGRFFIVSGCGEYELPWRVCVQEKEITCSLGEVKNLFHFTNLAKTDWQEAVKLFYSEGFRKIFGSDQELVNLYRGFSRACGNEANVEEFLVAVRKKQPLSFSSVLKEIRIPEIRGRASEDILIVKNGWGAARISMETDGDFLGLEKSWLTDDDFLGNQCRVPVYLDEDRMHEGRNYGKVSFFYSHGSFDIPIIVEKRSAKAKAGDRRLRELKKSNLRMVKLYQELRTKKINALSWRAMAQECVEQMAHLSDQKAVPKLFHAHLLITEDKMEEAGWILDHVTPFLNEQEPAVYCYYLYLTTLYNREDSYVHKTADRVEELFSHNTGEWRIAWLLLFLSRDINRSAVRKWEFLEQQFQGGCTSPILYLEALQLLNASPTLLPKLDGIAKRILFYGAKNGIVGPDLKGHVIYLIGREKYYDGILFEILKLFYDSNQDEETLQAVCTLLIKGGKTGGGFYPWYLKGVEKELRITRLYEHFMMSVDLDRDVELPRIVLLYFAWQSNLEYENAAYLYTYVEKHKEEDPDLYAAYRPQIDRFVLQQLHKGRINRHLAYLYVSVIRGPMLTKDSGRELAGILCSVEARCRDLECRKLVVVHNRLKGEQVYALHNGKAVIDLYSSQDIVFFEDDNRNRRLAGDDMSLEPMFKDSGIREAVAAFAQDTPGYHLAVTDALKVSVDAQNYISYEQIIRDPSLSEEYGNKVRDGLVRYYFDADRMEELDLLLKRLEPEELTEGQRQEAARCMVLRGMYGKAYEWMRGMDVMKLDAGILLRLCSRLLEQKKHTDEERMTLLCFAAAVQGKYDSNILRQLVGYFEGATGELEAIKTAAEGFGLDTYPICERLLEQMLFTGADVSERMDLLRRYIAEGGSTELEAAFLHRCSESFVIDGQPIHVYMIHEILRLEKNGEKFSDMCRIACLRYYARNKAARSRDTDALLTRMGTFLISENRILPVLREFPELVPGAELLADKTFIVYKGSYGQKVVLNYRYVLGENAGEEYLTMEMPYIYAGISCAAFILFAGEGLQYFVTAAEDHKVLDSGLLKAEECQETVRNSRYGMLNAAAQEQLFSADGQGISCLENYLHTDFGVRELFRPLT